METENGGDSLDFAALRRDGDGPVDVEVDVWLVGSGVVVRCAHSIECHPCWSRPDLRPAGKARCCAGHDYDRYDGKVTANDSSAMLHAISPRNVQDRNR